jgi:hypothetical protein
VIFRLFAQGGLQTILTKIFPPVFRQNILHIPLPALIAIGASVGVTTLAKSHLITVVVGCAAGVITTNTITALLTVGYTLLETIRAIWFTVKFVTVVNTTLGTAFITRRKIAAVT